MLEKRNASAERPDRPDICIELKAPPSWPVGVGLLRLLLVTLGLLWPSPSYMVMFMHWIPGGISKVEERVKSMYCGVCGDNKLGHVNNEAEMVFPTW